MTSKYFADTDTTPIDLSANAVAETREITEHIYIDLDDEGGCKNMVAWSARKSDP